MPGFCQYTSTIDNELPTAFTSLGHARDYSSTWISRLFYFMRTTADVHKYRDPGDVPLETYAAAKQLEDRFVNIDRLLHEYMQRPNLKLSVREQNGLSMMRARAKMDRVLSAVCLHTEATMFDQFLETFEEIYVICKYVLDVEPADRVFAVSLDDGLLLPLYFTVTNCRDGRLRTAALAAMKRLPARPGVWHVEALTGMAEGVVRYEERLCTIKTPRCSDIPEWQRVHSTAFDGFHHARPQDAYCVSAHFRVRPNGMDGEWMDVEQVIEWLVYPRGQFLRLHPNHTDFHLLAATNLRVLTSAFSALHGSTSILLQPGQFFLDSRTLTRAYPRRGLLM